jgi:alkylation response protein AidB-like acyl-CoA dehydrogenase
MAEDLEEYRQQVRAWLAENMPPRPESAGRRQRGSDTPETMARGRMLQKRLAEGGYAGITWPVEYGGQGLTKAHEAIFWQESVGYEMPHLGQAGSLTLGYCAPTILTHASDAFKRRHIPRMLALDEVWVQLLSDPSAGSDLAGITTSAVRDGDHWVLNGSKIWTSGGMFANYGLCLARTDWDVPKHRGLTWFGVPLTREGVTVQPIRQISGLTNEFCQEFFDDVILTDDDVVGEVNNGWTVAQTVLMYERGGGDSAAGPSEESPLLPEPGFAPDLVSLAAARGLEHDALIKQRLAHAYINDLMRRELDRRVQTMMKKGNPNLAMAAFVKMGWGVIGAERARIALEVGGPRMAAWKPDDTVANGTVIEYLMGRQGAIAGGTNEMQRNSIGERLLGLPREPSFDREKPFNEVQRLAKAWTGQM